MGDDLRRFDHDVAAAEAGDVPPARAAADDMPPAPAAAGDREAATLDGGTESPLPAGEAGNSPPPTASPTLRGLRRAPSGGRRSPLPAIIAAAVALILLGIALGRVLAPSSPSGTATPTATPAAGTSFSPVNGAPITPVAILGAGAHLAAPREAITLPDGHIAVADTGNGRLVLLDAAGHVVQSTSLGRAKTHQPYAVIVALGHIAVLDAQRDSKSGSIDLFDYKGHFTSELVHNAALLAGRGMTFGPDGNFYVANPLLNSVVVVGSNGMVKGKFTSALSNAPGRYNQPSDVAVGHDGLLYVVDNQNNRIQKLTLGGSFQQQWPIPPSDTIKSVHVLPLADGRVLATDPNGSLLVYPAHGGSPIRYPLQIAGQAHSPLGPLGLAPASGGRILVTDERGNRLFVVLQP